MPRKTPRAKSSRPNQEACERPECERRSSDLKLLVECHEGLAKAMADAVPDLNSPFSAFLVILNAKMPDQDGSVTL